MSSFV
ncbi:RNA polymerase subunit RPO18, partial [Monkeypox virus]